MTPRRKLVATAAGAIALVAVVVLLVPRLADVDRYRGVIEERASRAIGREVRLGSVRLSLWPVAGLSVDHLTVAGAPEEGGDLLVADGLRVGARLLPLLRGRLAITSAELVRPTLRLARDAEGRWNIARLIAERPTPGGEASASGRLSIDRFRSRDGRVMVTDATTSPPIELVLDAVDLELENVATGESLAVRLDTGFADAPGARLRLDGEAGPLGRPEQPFPLRGEATASDLDGELVAALGRLAGLDLSSVARHLETTSGRIEVDAAIPERATLRGELDLGEVSIELPAEEGRRRVTANVAARFDLAAAHGADALRVESLKVDVDDATLALEGTLDRVGPAARNVDLRLLPVRLPADRLAAFVALVMPDLPFSFSSPRPVEAEARVHGVAGGGSRPAVEGRLTVSDLRFEHEALELPIEHVAATVAFAGERLDASGLEAVLGASDLHGELSVEGWKAPRVGFDLTSTRANLDQLFGALESEPGAAERPRSTESVLDRVVAEGRIRVEHAIWGELEAANLEATARLANGTVTLDPLTADLYGGRFSGRVDARPGRSPLPFELSGRADDVRVDQFLAGALDLEDRLAGRFSGTVRAGGAAGEWEAVARSLEGQGEMRIEDGQVQSFPLLRTVADVAGVFGEETLAEIAGRLADSSTRFAVLRGDFRLDDGALTFRELALESADFALTGAGAVDLVSTGLSGAGTMTFSEEISELMRREGSRAGELFWDDRPGRVALPLELRGALSAPSALVDWEAAVKGYAERRLEREVERQVGRLLERILKPEPTPEPP
jgi:AsmA protein